MKRFFSLALTIVLIAFGVSFKKEVLETVDNVFGGETIVDWEKIPVEKSDFGSQYKNHFDLLTQTQKKAYNHILEEIFNAELEFPSHIQLPSLTTDELTQVIQALTYDNPTLMCFGRNNTLVSSEDLHFLHPEYTMSPSEQRVKINTLNSISEQLLAQLPENADEFRTELFIHDYIVNFCSYDVSVAETSSTPFSCLVDGLSACEGYSKATKFLCENAGLECYTVSGKAVNSDGQTEGHMWNIINIDGEYYHLDVTWDDPATQDCEETLSHLFINLSDEDISIDHFEYQSFFECSSTKANYFVKTGRLLGSLNNSDVTKLKKLMSKSSDGHVEICFDSKDHYETAVRQLITNGKIYEIIDSTNRIYGTNISSDSVGYIENKERFALDLFFR